MSSTEIPLNAAGHRRAPVTMPGYHRGRPPKNKGLRFPADPPPVDEIIAVTRAAGNGADGARLRALIVVLWRAGLRISEALDLAETDLDRTRGALIIRRGKGGRRREAGMDRWAWDQLTRTWRFAPPCRSAPCSACFTVRPRGGAGRPPRCASSCAEQRKRRASAGASRLIS
jgi:integrase